MSEKCNQCGIREISNKKRGLCRGCYQRFYNRTKLGDHDNTNPFYSLKKIQQIAEVTFVKNYFNHKNWIPQPANFYLEGEKYTPDFYDQTTNEFIEVIGTRQAFHANKKKYELFKQKFPGIKLIFFDSHANEINTESPRIAWNAAGVR